MREKILKAKSFEFALIIKVCNALQDDKKEFVISKQLLKSGTAVGALIWKAEYVQSRADFINMLSIGAKECNETLYWLELLNSTTPVSKEKIESTHALGEEIRKMLSNSIITTKKSIQRIIQN